MALITVANVKTEVTGFSDSDTTYDDLLAALVLAIPSLFDELTGRKIERDTFTEYHSTRRYVEELQLKNYPIVSITSIHDDPDRDYAAASLIAAADYTFDADSGVVFYDGNFFQGNNNIKIVYVAGYNSSTFPASWKEIWVRQCAHWFKDAKGAKWATSNISQPLGGSIVVKSTLKSNLLPDFMMLAEKEGGLKIG